ncbi:GNAT family N-acetyltransferase [Vibrio sp. Vb1554]|uniref:GNAT family N-acetyltransferase n=1 Tax=Vibrio TaxID=662 RepID=UPI00080340A4|nr:MULTISPECIES: GNAT family N-acetyltransferase [Vibrio]ANP64607.1 hypothetical protein BAU10_06275 [Vibrio alginolyticus]MDW3048066.1 GNAT family N-acetyltransferase [Vibrio sp. Vb1554]
MQEKLIFDFEPDTKDVKYVFDMLELHNSDYINIHSEPFKVTVRNQEGEIIAGIESFTKWGLLLVDILWVDKKYRGFGLGKKLMDEAEMFAKKAGVNGVELYTMSFQAQHFYEKLGYETIGEIKDCYQGQSKIYMYKKLSDSNE